MTTNNINCNNNNNKSYDTKCIYHPNQDIIYICLTCGYGTEREPACIKCVTSNHQAHKLISIDDNQDLIIDISIHFKNNLLPQLNEQLEKSKSLLNQSNQTYNEIENNHKEHLAKINKHFGIFHKKLSLLELDITKQLKLNLDKNKLIKDSITTILEDRITSINNIINNSNNNNGAEEDGVNENKLFFEMMKYDYKCRKSIITNQSIKNDYTHYEIL